ncbi:MAG: excinuclease ABC subunit UvrA [Marinifilaceae bacterium]|jgi:excinuclease ABC subunit A|nr:excinuclease ABC subunit UvrA [Marinifilaceae bacterium]
MKPEEFLINQNKAVNVYGARVHNLKNIDISIPHRKLSVITGLSGSGKSSLAFDTIHAEGQRRYLETFSTYARQFIGNMERPDVDKITGLSPVISIEQKTTNKNPRSTVGTVTEIYDFLRLLYARASNAYSYESGKQMIQYTDAQIIDVIFNKYLDKNILVLAPLIKGRKGHYKELFQKIRNKGFLYVRIDGKIEDLRPNMIVDRYKSHDIEIVIDKLKVKDSISKRLKESIETAMDRANGLCMIMEKESEDFQYFSRALMCPDTGISYQEPAPHSFSFNSPHGACPRCKGLGSINNIDIDKIIPNDSLSIYKGGIEPLGSYSKNIIFEQIDSICSKYNCTLKTPIKDIPKKAIDDILYGTTEPLFIKNTVYDTGVQYFNNFEGILKYINLQYEETISIKERRWAEQYISRTTCPECNGYRLKKESLWFKIAGKNIGEVASMNLLEFREWIENIEDTFSDKQILIASEVIKEIKTRLGFLTNIGLNYLSLNRPSASLSGGESQRIRLASQIGSQLVNVLYILDEPSIGLHQRDNEKLISSLKHLRDKGNTVIVVEHDKDMIEAADYIVDIGPKAGKHGGEVSAYGTYKEFIEQSSLTIDYLKGKKEISVPTTRRKGNGKTISLKGCCGNNLKNIDVEFPLGKLVCVTGVSGSGKSTLINGTLYPILSAYFYNSLKEPLKYKSIDGIENIDKVVEINQSPIGRTPRSNPATYTGLFGEIRQLYSLSPEAKIRGFKPGRFSFNVKGGRCETCKGAGVQTIEMNFLPDVYVKCKECNGKRYNKETLEIKYKGQSINDVLDMTINQAVEFFDAIPKIYKKLLILQQVGLGYITLGQASTTLSGGEAQRVKLATELAKKDTGSTLYILDEPTTGLHFEDIRVLMKVINMLVDKGNSVIIIEHNLDVIKMADHIIDIGPEGGNGGGRIVCEGSPEEIVNNKESITAPFLKKELIGGN